MSDRANCRSPHPGTLEPSSLGPGTRRCRRIGEDELTAASVAPEGGPLEDALPSHLRIATPTYEDCGTHEDYRSEREEHVNGSLGQTFSWVSTPRVSLMAPDTARR